MPICGPRTFQIPPDPARSCNASEGHAMTRWTYVANDSTEQNAEKETGSGCGLGTAVFLFFMR